MERFKSMAALALPAALAADLLAGCSSTTGAKTEAGEESTIKLGGLAPLAGNYAEYGEGFQIGFQKATDETNAKGGVNGRRFEIEIKDTQGDAVASSNMATNFAEDEGVMAILGDFTSGARKANVGIVNRYGIVRLSPTASAPDYANMSKYCFNIMGRQDMEAPYPAKYILKKYLGVQKIAVIHVDSNWGLSCYDNFMEQAEREELGVTAEKYAAGKKDFGPLTTKMRSIDPDCLVVMDQGDAVAAIFDQADAAGWDIQHASLGPDTFEQLTSQLTTPGNLITTSPFFFGKNNETLPSWAKSFEEEAGLKPTIHPVCAYDHVYLIANAVRRVGDGEITRDAIQQVLAESENEGVTGALNFTPNGDVEHQYMICGIKDAKWMVLEGFEYGVEGL